MHNGSNIRPPKKRVLFVDDDPVLLRVYGMMLEDQSSAWEVVTAENAQLALELIDRSAFDIVVSDMRMPGMSGAELMVRVRDRHPRISRIILSALQDQEEVAQSLGATHQFVPKPFELRALKKTLGHICELNDLLHDERLQTLVSRLNVLPSFPSIYLEVLTELEAEEPSIDKIAEIVARDPGLTTKVLQVANSAVLALAHRISSPIEAVQYLGFGTIRSLALSVHVFSSFERMKLKGVSVERLWEHAMRTGLLARTIMQLERTESSAAEDACTAGMLHDIGKLMLADNLPREFTRALELAGERNTFLHEAELEVFGATHAAVGAYLLGLWGLPAPIVEAVAFHHTPGRTVTRSFGLLAAVHAANVLEQEHSREPVCAQPSALDRDFLSATDVWNRTNLWRERAAEILGAEREATLL